MLRTVVRSTALACCVVIALAACSKKVDSDSVEKQVVEKLNEAYPEAKTLQASCPGDVEAEKGKKFECEVDLDGESTDIKVDITDVEDKNFTFALEPTQAIVPITKLEQVLQQQTGATTRVSCGEATVVLKDPGETIDCTVQGNGQSRTLKVRFKDTEGNYEVV